MMTSDQEVRLNTTKSTGAHPALIGSQQGIHTNTQTDDTGTGRQASESPAKGLASASLVVMTAGHNNIQIIFR